LKTLFKYKKYLYIRNKPQFKAIVNKTRIQTPRKPNSARRAVAKVVVKASKDLVVYIPGIGHNLRKHSSILVRGGGARDLPGVYYSSIRGVYDLACVQNRFNKRSKYGISRPEHLIKKLRRKLRNV
jgi:small subunit ribosomal protein S12